ncbi:hypothetical protein CDL15_Pgr008754 [Punica granatum]|uniref:DFDF domain-containing protein n=1 Tax=Punica granatum TaxID=22663 RepID=A0A218VX50_PUNGR|nr:hypothetical protein CDL15_Pgr008754 [Punica granatum]
MRYEGVLYYINPQDATFGLKNVRSFGTEGRRKDGPQVLPDERVFEYIQFRGSDIKDLKVLPSPTPQDTSSVFDDPAIIQSHYIPPMPKSTSAPYAASAGIANLTSTGGLQTSVVKDSFPLFPPVNLASIGTMLPPPSAQVNAGAMLPHAQGLGGPSAGITYLQQQSLVGSPQGLPAVYTMKQQLQHPAFNSSIPSSTSNLNESSQSFMLPVTLGALISTPNLITSSAFPSNSASLNSLVTRNAVSDSRPGSLSTVALNPMLPSLSPMTATLLERSPIIPQIIDKSNLVIASGSQKESIPGTLPSVDGPSTTSNTEELKPSVVVPGQFLQTAPTNSLSRSTESVREDVEVVKVLTSESRQTSSKNDKAPILQLQTASATEKSGANAPIRKYVKSGTGQIEKKIDGAYTRASQIRIGSSKERGQKKDATDPKTQESMRGSPREGGKKLSGAASRSGTGGRGRGRGRVATVIPRATKFTEDFDFEAMNEKFNKDELWGDLGKNKKDQLKGKANAGEHEAAKSEGSATAMNLDIKTFGDLKIVRGNRRTQRVAGGSQSRGSNDGRGRHYAGQGRGKVQAVWTQVT